MMKSDTQKGLKVYNPTEVKAKYFINGLLNKAYRRIPEE